MSEIVELKDGEAPEQGRSAQAHAKKKKPRQNKAVEAIKKFFRDLRSEAKKITWSTPSQVLKNTLIVLAFIFIVGIFIWTVDALFSLVLKAVY